MKKNGKWIISVLTRVIVIILVVLLLPFAKNLFFFIFPDITGEIRTQSQIIQQKLRSSNRLEVTTVDEEGILKADTNVVLLGTVGSTSIRYRYTASIGIDMNKVNMTEDIDRIIFELPDPEVLNDGIEAIEIKRNNLFSKAIDRSVESLLNEQRIKCREQFTSEKQHSERIWNDTVCAFDQSVCKWLEQYGERHYTFEFKRQSEPAAE